MERHVIAPTLPIPILILNTRPAAVREHPASIHGVPGTTFTLEFANGHAYVVTPAAGADAAFRASLTT